MRTLLLTACCVVTQLSYAQTQPSKADKKLAAQLRTDVTYLASDELEGRRTGSEGERKAGDYIIAQYEAAKVAPYKGQYRYPFHFVYGREVGENTIIRVGGKVLRDAEEAFPLPFSASKRVAEDVIPDVMEQGNIWLLPFYATEADSKDAHYDWEKAAYDKCQEAIKQGATAVVFYDNYGAKFAPEFNGKSEYEPLDIPVVFVQYNPWHLQTSAYKNTIPVELNISMKKSDRTGTNIAAYIDNKAKYTVVLGAHYDHLGRGEDGNSLYTGKDAAIHNGADDNASGTAALLSLSARIKKAKLKHYNYLFINFSGEELGLLGSKAIVKDAGLDSTHIAYMLNMDMVGRLNDSTHALTLGGLGTAPEWAQANELGSKEFKIIPDSSGVGPSDHTSFYNVGIPVLFFFTGTHHDYHKPSDDADLLNYPGEARVVDYVYDITAMMDKQPRPHYTATKQSSLGRVRFKVTLGIMPDYSYSEDNGLRVDGVTDGKAASRAGIKTGDVITQLGEQQVKGIQSYMEGLGKLKEGQQTEVKVLRDGKVLTLPVKL